MTLDELIAIVDSGYGDGVVRNYHEDRDGDHGDILAKFIAVEVAETFDGDSSDADQFSEAERVLERAQEDIARALHALDMARRGLEFGNRA